MNLLVTLNKNYLPYLIILLKSILKTNPNKEFTIFIISKEIDNQDVATVEEALKTPLMKFELLHFDESLLIGAPTSSRYPLEIYYRIFAAKVLPSTVSRILYLDPDIVVINQLDSLYNLDFEGNYFIGATHIRKVLRKFNQIRVRAHKSAPYINTGVMVMNIELLRNEQVVDEVYEYINKYKRYFTLPDQDIIFGLYGHKIKLVDYLKYNLSDRMLSLYNLRTSEKLDLAWVKKHSVVIHYCGRNKPWRPKYRGILNVFYDEIANLNE